MSDLLELAISAHGGWERWQSVNTLTAHATIGGGIWSVKGRAGILDDVRIEASTKRQHLEYSPFGAAGRHSEYEPHGTAIVSDAGEVIERRSEPRSSFAGHGLMTPWDDQHLIYFSGYAMWTYLNTPFLFRENGFDADEIEPWDEDGSTWRRLRVRFPENVHSHSTEQTFYFDQDGVLKRHDYSADVLGGTRSSNYALEPRMFGGILFPTKRRVYAVADDNRPMRERVAVAIDFQSITAL